MFIRLIVLTLLISGVSTRGVPAADDTNGIHVEPKRTQTDTTEQSSEHVTLTECEDCKLSHEDDVNSGNNNPGSKDNIHIGVNDDLPIGSNSDIDIGSNHEIHTGSTENFPIGGNVLPTGSEEDAHVDVVTEAWTQTTKPKRTRRLKSFLTFHRIRLNVNRDRKQDDSLTTKIENEKSHTSVTLGRKYYTKKPDRNVESSDENLSNENFYKAQSGLKPKDHQYKNYEIVKPKKADSRSTDVSKGSTPDHATNSGPNNTFKHKLEKETATDNDDISVDENTHVIIGATTNVNIQILQTNIDNNNQITHTTAGNKEINADHIMQTGSHDAVVSKEYDVKSAVAKPDKTIVNNFDQSEEINIITKISSDTPSTSHNLKSEHNELGIIGEERAKDIDKEVTDKYVRLTANDEKGTAVRDTLKGIVKDIVDKGIGATYNNENDAAVDNFLPETAGDRWSSKGLSQVPDVERLERRLHPRLDAPVNDIIQSMRNMVRLVQYSLHKVDVDFKLIHNTTRWKYMVGVRNQLMELTKDNDRIYDTVLDASLLTKEIYRKAHERKHPIAVDRETAAMAYRLRLTTNMNPEIRQYYIAARRELELAKRLIEQIQSRRHQRDLLASDYIRLQHIVRDRLPVRALYDLHRRAEQTIRVLTNAQPLDRIGDKTRLYGHMNNDSSLNMKRARELSREGYDLLMIAKRVLMDNKRKVQEHSHIVRKKLPGSIADMPFDDGRMDLFVAWDKTNFHANHLTDIAVVIHMKLVPLIKHAGKVMASKANIGFGKLLDNSVNNVKDIVKRLVNIVDEIRKEIGDEGILQERCESVEGSGFFSDDEDIIIDCGAYVTEPDGSGDDRGISEGSGELDETPIDIDTMDSAKAKHNNEKPSVDETPIDIDTMDSAKAKHNNEKPSVDGTPIDIDTMDSAKAKHNNEKHYVDQTPIDIDTMDSAKAIHNNEKPSVDEMPIDIDTMDSAKAKHNNEKPSVNETPINIDTMDSAKAKHNNEKPSVDEMPIYIDTMDSAEIKSDTEKYSADETPIEINTMDISEIKHNNEKPSVDETPIHIDIMDSVDANGDPEKPLVDVNITKWTGKSSNNLTALSHTTGMLKGTDDEDLATEIESKSAERHAATTTTPRTTTTPAETTTADTTDDLFFDTWGWFRDQSDIEIELDPDNHEVIALPTSLNELIRERLYNYSQSSKHLLKHADATSANIKELGLSWQKVQKRFSRHENKTLNALAIISKWKAESEYFQAVHDRVLNAQEDIRLTEDLVDIQCKAAIYKANKKLETMKETYEEQSDFVKHAADPTVVKETVAQVSAVSEMVREINRLKQVYPSPCGTLERLDRRIRSNITELRKKIERAKRVASSLQIAVAVPKEGYVEFPISKESHETHHLTSRIQMLLKHSGSDGRLVSVRVGKSESLSLEVKNDALNVVKSVKGDEKTIPLYSEEMTDKWYLIKLDRFGSMYNWTMIGEDGMFSNVGTDIILNEERPMMSELLPTWLRVGGSGELSACVLGLEIDGRSINMFDTSNNQSLQVPCSSQRRWTSHETHLLMDGSGHCLLNLVDVRSLHTLQSITLTFNPRSDGTVFSLRSKRMGTEVDVYVDNGLLVVYIRYHDFETKLRSTVRVYSTDQMLKILLAKGRVKHASVVLNGKSDVFKTAIEGKRKLHSRRESIYLGGIADTNSSMVGCFKSVALNDEDVPFHLLQEAEGAVFGTCQDKECVEFQDNSIPIGLTNMSVVRMIHVSVRRSSLGPILQYTKHKEKFNLVVTLDTEGLAVEETIGDNSERISLDGHLAFIELMIKDDKDDETVYVTAAGVTEEFSYKNGGVWGGRWVGSGKEKDGPVSYSVTLGTGDEDSPPFLGSIQDLIIDGRPMDMLGYVESNQLKRCTSEPTPRQPDKEDESGDRITCS